MFQVWVAHLRQPSRIAKAEADSRVVGNLADAISNQNTVVLFSGSRYELKRFAETVVLWSKALIRVWIADAWIWMGIGLFMIGIQALLLYVGVQLWQEGLFTVGDFVLVQAYLITAFERMERINRELRRMGDAYSDAHEMAEILDTLHEVSDKPDAKALAVSRGEIAFRGVGFHFHEEKAVFEDFNLRVEGGEKVALIGPSGAGKTTITKLLLRLFDVKEGAVEIDGQNIADVTQESLRNAIAFVPQEPILFHRTLMENIRYGRRDASDEEVIEAARQAHCHEFISVLPLGYETFVGERGVKLSGGERQRVAIARAILKNAPVLVLDEATSSLDSESEVLIQKALATLMEGKTVIVIAHRLSTIQRMDRIVALEGGAIAEEGTHQELLAKKGLYAKLWSHQAGGFLQDEE
jgi:ATP-binding cassette subfamily B protein